MHLVNILRIITFSFLVGHSNLTISDFNSFRFFGTPCRLDNTINDNIIKIPGYDIVRRDRDGNGGCVAIYIRSIISYKNHIEFIPDNLESICLKIQKPKSKPLLIVTWYRPPNSNTSILNDFETLLRN
jgi:hypothetical protein